MGSFLEKFWYGVILGVVFITAGILWLVIFTSQSPNLPDGSQEVLGAKTSQTQPVIVSDDGVESTYEVAGSTVEEILNAANIEFFPEDRIFALVNPELGLGTKITIERATPIKITDGGRTYTVRTWKMTVAELLDEKSIGLDPQDKIMPALDNQLSKWLNIIITRVQENTTREIVKIPFETIKKKDNTLYIGNTNVAFAGKEGKKEITYKLRYENNILVTKDQIDEKIIENPQNQIVLVGTKPRISVNCGGWANQVADAAGQYGVSGDNMCRCLLKESGGNPNRISGSGRYHGLFQYLLDTWASLSSQAGYGGAAWTNGTAQIYTTAWAWAHGYCGKWPSCPCP